LQWHDKFRGKHFGVGLFRESLRGTKRTTYRSGRRIKAHRRTATVARKVVSRFAGLWFGKPWAKGRFGAAIGAEQVFLVDQPFANSAFGQ